MYKINIYSKEKGGGKVQEDNRRLYTKAIWYLVIATITMLLINIFSIARFSSSVGGTAEIEIATPILEIVSETTELDNLDINNQDIEFEVKNFNSTEASGVALNYRIRLVVDGAGENEKPIKAKLYKIQNNERVECSMSDNYVSESFYMPHTEHTTNRFVLSTSVENSEYQNNSYQMKIVLDAEQKI